MKESTKQLVILLTAVGLIFIVGVAATVGETRNQIACKTSAINAGWNAEQVKEVCK